MRILLDSADVTYPRSRPKLLRGIRNQSRSVSL